MRVFTFNSENNSFEIRGIERPVLNLVKGIFNSNDLEWVTRLYNTTLTVKASCYDENDSFLGSAENTLSLGSYITPDHKQPVLEMNYMECFLIENARTKIQREKYWVTSITIAGIVFMQAETFTLTVMDRDYVLGRVNYWEKRVNDLFNQIMSWTNSMNSINVKEGRPMVMSEEMMRTFLIPDRELKTLDIFQQEKLILSFKPKALWTIAANGRIDIISAKGSYILVDFAEHFQNPVWKIYAANKKDNREFTEAIFQEIFSFLVE